MVNYQSFGIIDKSIPVGVWPDVVHQLRHGRIIDLHADDAHKSSPAVDRNIIGKHPHIQIVRNIRPQPDRPAGGFRNGEPHQGGSILRVIERDIRYLMLLKAFPLQVGVPEALYIGRNRRINPIVIGQDAVGSFRCFRKNVPGSVHMRLKLFPLQAFQVAVHKG